jgi:hypothetical protein
MSILIRFAVSFEDMLKLFTVGERVDVLDYSDPKRGFINSIALSSTVLASVQGFLV